MDKFVKRNTVREIEIFGNTYSVDFGKDEIPFIIKQVQRDNTDVTATISKDLTPQKQFEEALEAGKKIFKQAINDIIGNPKAAEQIFKEDNSAALHGDIYTFLVNQHIEVMTEESPYSPKRVK